MSLTFDVIELRVLEPPGPEDDLDVPVVEVTVNGVDLRRIVVDAMKQRRPGIDFMEPSDSQFLGVHHVALPSRHWLGAPNDPELVIDGHAAVLVCSCGAFGCGGTAARIDCGADTVAWSNFVNPWGTSDPVPTLTFERKQYERAIEELGRST